MLSMVDNPPQRVLVTGAAGYIGSHTVLALTRRGHEVVAVDDFSNSSRRVPARLDDLSPRPIRWLELDVRDAAAVEATLEAHRVDGVIHFAGRKSVEESCRDPLGYYDVNLMGTLSLVEAVVRHRIPRLVFSSSATVYAATQASPVAESGALSCASPYGRSKLMAERIIRDMAAATSGLQVALLRYFNPVGADASGDIGESPLGTPSNLMPVICRVASGLAPAVSVFGADYPTRDGTGVRDYVHVDDVARAHVDALAYLQARQASLTLNIGSGLGYSVFEMLRAFARATGIDVPHRIAGRRPGDVAELYADTSAAERLLGWRAEHDLERMCVDAWRWQQRNPRGFDD